MSKYLLIFQTGGGSTAEAMNVDAAFGPYDTSTEAESAGEHIYRTLSAVSSMHRDESLYQVLPIPDTTPTERDAFIQAFIDHETADWS